MLYKLTLEKPEVDLLGKAIGMLTLSEGMAIFTKIKLQCIAQENAQIEAESYIAPGPDGTQTIPTVAETPPQA